ncbi:sporulation initiation inhibitor protein soj [Candidatus Magnetobacterium bavaricum]|uniref:Sporulation initiation inhibitor protein soj n=1 Tax=Candidatus Magnetobacterium bavaricum TaxID=29290 RepID=A0A0F3GXZ1_9BACT|nr:sporulation initiation inhibitor protein soj [Candidatus Magnetobacterium bavaricum]
MGKIISISNQKGGVGKTTTAINVAASMASMGKDILIIDSDPQCNSTSAVGIDKKDIDKRNTQDNRYKNLYDIYGGHCTAEETIINTPFERLSIIPASRHLVDIEIEHVGKERREWILAEAINKIRDRFEYIFVDCPPSLGLLTLNSLVAADSVMIPVQCEYFALEGLGLLANTIMDVQDSFNPSLKIEGILMTMYDIRNNLSLEVVKDVRDSYGDKVYTTMIPRNVVLGEAPSFGKPAMYYDIRSKGAQSYISLAQEILNGKAGQRA